MINSELAQELATKHVKQLLTEISDLDGNNYSFVISLMIFVLGNHILGRLGKDAMLIWLNELTKAFAEVVGSLHARAGCTCSEDDEPENRHDRLN